MHLGEIRAADLRRRVHRCVDRERLSGCDDRWSRSESNTTSRCRPWGFRSHAWAVSWPGLDGDWLNCHNSRQRLDLESSVGHLGDQRAAVPYQASCLGQGGSHHNARCATLDACLGIECSCRSGSVDDARAQAGSLPSMRLLACRACVGRVPRVRESDWRSRSEGALETEPPRSGGVPGARCRGRQSSSSVRLRRRTWW